MLLPSLLLALPALATLGSAQQTPFAAPQVYLYPSPPSSSSSLPPSLTADQASSVLAHHLGDTRHAFLPDALDDLEHWAKLMWDDIKVATGLGGSGAADDGAARARGRVLVVQGVQDPSAFLSEEPTFTLDETSTSSLDELLSPFLHRASDFLKELVQEFKDIKAEYQLPKTFLDLFDLASDEASKAVKQELTALSEWVDSTGFFNSEKTSDPVQALSLNSLTLLDPASEQYSTAEGVIQASISSLSSTQEPFILILTPPSTQLTRRQLAVAAPSSKIGSGPVFSISECFTTSSACTNGTNACSGHGECLPTKRAGKTCWSCECGTTVESDGETQWAGRMCEKKDISSSFALILFTLVLLLFVVMGSIALLSSAGNQPLPSVLAAGSGGAKRD